MNSIQLPFDQYQRYRVVTDAIEAVRDGKKPLKVLDVGGSPGLLLDFLPKDDIYILDYVCSPAGRFIRGSGAALPFRDEAFDIAISVDVLEHVAPEVREAFIVELKRVSRGYVFLAAPFKTGAVLEAERILFDVIKAAKGEEHTFLQEHLEHGLPEEAAVREALEAGGWQTMSVPNGALKRWLPMMALSIYVTGDKFLTELAGRINSFYNSNYYENDNMEPAYRHLLASCRGGFKSESIQKIEGLARGSGQEKDLDLSWLSLLLSLIGHNEMKKTMDSEREEFQNVLEERDRHIRSLKNTVDKKDRRIERQKKTIEGSQGVIDELNKRLDSLESSNGVKALKGMGIIKKPR
ncbi:MAG: class I SAM-dependent methyltransferase [Thermodesulfobacteriota bacterium]